MRRLYKGFEKALQKLSLETLTKELRTVGTGSRFRVILIEEDSSGSGQAIVSE